MAEYIDKDYVTKCLMESWANSGIPSDAKNKMLKWLNKAPTAADAIVVRCKNCKHWFDVGKDYASCDMDALVRDADFFCAAWERGE